MRKSTTKLLLEIMYTITHAWNIEDVLYNEFTEPSEHPGGSGNYTLFEEIYAELEKYFTEEEFEFLDSKETKTRDQWKEYIREVCK